MKVIKVSVNDVGINPNIFIHIFVNQDKLSSIFLVETLSRRVLFCVSLILNKLNYAWFRTAINNSRKQVDASFCLCYYSVEHQCLSEGILIRVDRIHVDLLTFRVKLDVILRIHEWQSFIFVSYTFFLFIYFNIQIQVLLR